nr:MAG TPA: holin [Caudoviricetes sp.]
MAFGGWSDALITLIVFMALDYVTGLIVAGIFKKSKKSENGALESRAGFKGLCRKGVALMIVLVAVRLDIVMHTTYIKDAVIIAFVANESISIIENAGLMGIPVPGIIARAIDVLRNDSEKVGTN